jgi:poly-gamma-glutamate synthesis protein (capsule biosynthesis protein)
VLLAAVGDVLVDRPEPNSALSGIRPLLAAADVVFGNFEGVLTDRHEVVPGASSAAVVGTANAAGLRGFDVLSLANNHAMDAGRQGLLDTQKTLADLGVVPVGAGPDAAAALAPAVLEQRGVRVAVLAVSAVLQHGAQARPGVAGVAPLRAEDAYLPPYPGVSCPGIPPRVVSILNESDWIALEAAIGQAKDDADFVVVSAHWGDHTRPWVLTDHEKLCAELIADAGADLVLGHHQHVLRGVDFHGRTPVFHGLGHAVFDQPRLAAELADNGLDVTEWSAADLAEAFGEHGIYPRPEHPAFPFHPLARRTGVAVVELAEGGVTRCGVVPCLIDTDGIARPVGRGDGEWPDLVGFLTECQTRAGLATRVIADGDWELAGHPVIQFTPPPET